MSSDYEGKDYFQAYVDSWGYQDMLCINAEGRACIKSDTVARLVLGYMEQYAKVLDVFPLMLYPLR